MSNYGCDQCGNKKQISQSSSCSTKESFLFQIDCWIFSVQTHPYCINLSVMHLTFLHWPNECCLTFQLCNFILFHLKLITISVKVFQCEWGQVTNKANWSYQLMQYKYWSHFYCWLLKIFCLESYVLIAWTHMCCIWLLTFDWSTLFNFTCLGFRMIAISVRYPQLLGEVKVEIKQISQSSSCSINE